MAVVNESIGFLVVDMVVVAVRNDFNQLVTRIMASQSASESSKWRKSRFLATKLSIMER
jgi:hypothetical protein